MFDEFHAIFYKGFDAGRRTQGWRKRQFSASVLVPVRCILMGVPVEKAPNRAAMSNVDSLDFFIGYAREQQDYRL